jgi:pimeloyl-ACP methyl ester carboxylesterase
VSTLPPGLHVVEHHHPKAPLGQQPEAAAVTVVLVHGSLDRGASFARVVRRLPEVPVLTYDRRGYHHSRGAPGVARTLDEHVEDLLAVVGDGPAAVVGHSYGGDVALAAALRAPGAVRAVGAYEPPLPWMAWWPRRSASSIAGEDPAAFAEAFFRRMVGDAGWERLSDEARAGLQADGPALVAELSDLRRGGAPFDPSALEVPLVLGRGGASLPHHRRAVEALRAQVRSAEIVDIPGAAHGAPLSHPDAFARFVLLARRRAAALDASGGTP